MERILAKRIAALVLAVTCMFSVCSCGGNTGKDVSGASSSSSTISDKKDENDQPAKETQPEESTVKEVEYKKFDDFTRTQRVAYFDVYFDVPVYVETGAYGFISQTSQDYAIIVSSSREARSDMSVDTDFADVMNDTFHRNVRRYSDLECEDYTPDTTDTVMLPCGAEAVRFEGIQPADKYGTHKECYLYGYSFVFNDILLIVNYIVFDDSAVDDATRTELADYVDRMVQTVRTTEN